MRQLISKLRVPHGLNVPPMKIEAWGYDTSKRHRADLQLQVRPFHEMLHYELFRTPTSLQVEGGHCTYISFGFDGGV